jgi:hypothetical protein
MAKTKERSVFLAQDVNAKKKEGAGIDDPERLAHDLSKEGQTA